MGILALTVISMNRESLQTLTEAADSETSHNPSLRVADMNDEDVVQIFKALSGKSTYRIYTEIQETPRTASELQDQLETSIQNIHYHLDKLEDAGLIEVVDAQYSEKGTEMAVFGPTHSPLIISFAPEAVHTHIQTTLTRLLSAVAFLGVVSIGVELAFNWAAFTGTPETGSTKNVSVTKPPMFHPTLVETATHSPGLLIFAAGLLLISVYVTWDYTGWS